MRGRSRREGAQKTERARKRARNEASLTCKAEEGILEGRCVREGLKTRAGARPDRDGDTLKPEAGQGTDRSKEQSGSTTGRAQNCFQPRSHPKGPLWLMVSEIASVEHGDAPGWWDGGAVGRCQRREGMVDVERDEKRVVARGLEGGEEGEA